MLLRSVTIPCGAPYCPIISSSMISVMGASIVVIGLMGGSLGSRHGETVQMYIVAIMIELKSTFSRLLGYLLFNYLSLCPQLSCMHCNINPTLLIQGMANDNANVTCSSLTEVGATNSEIL